MIRQYNLSNRPIVTIRFDIIRSGLLCFIIENEGPQPAHDVIITVNDDFIDNLPDAQAKEHFMKLNESKLYLASHQRITLLLGGQHQFSEIALNKAAITIKYDRYIENTEIDISQYGLLLVYNSPLEDISQNIKTRQEQEKRFNEALLKSLPPKNRILHVVSHTANEDDALKYQLYKLICTEPRHNAEFLAEKSGIAREKALGLLIDLQKTDRLIQCIPGENTADDYKYLWLRS